MNVFEDLIGELKEENLLEETVFVTQKAENEDEFLGTVANESDFLNTAATLEFPKPPLEESKGDLSEPLQLSLPEHTEEIAPLAETIYTGAAIVKEEKPVFNGKEFYRKRAMEEVSGLQMVEHILSGVEREQNKTTPNLYNDIAVKKALHDFLQISEDVKSPEHAQAEFQLMQETETWCSALSHRDKRISIAHLRRFCETTKPPLSSQALISLARFYRNLPFSESVRGKFDLVVTRLFSKDVGGEKRVMVFSRDELIKHLVELYAEWSSISLYSADEDNSQVVLTAMKFEEFVTEAERADSFDELVENDFFNRLRLFKESTDEVFYAPLITAAAIESNVRIGNRYVELIEIERGKSDARNLREKYGFLHDQAISDSTSKTLQLVEILKEKAQEVKAPLKERTMVKKMPEKPAVIAKESKTKTKPNPVRHEKKTVEKNKKAMFAVNKWLLAACLLATTLGFGLYIWVNYIAGETESSTKVKKVNLDNSSLKDYLQTARISEGTFYAVTTPSWDALSLEKKEELLKKIFSFGGDKGYVKVHLLSKEGKAVGYASAQKTEVVTP
jgi:hypothetical protein